MSSTTQQPTTNRLQIFGVTIQISLRSLVNHLENAIIIISGPAIAISGIIAGIDLLTGGTMFKDVHWLSLTWAICLLLTLDFQVLVMGTRAKQIYANSAKSSKRKFVEILVIIVIAAAISSVSVQMQSIIARTQATTAYTDHAGLEHVRNFTIDEATAQMGINPIALIWERSALVLVLIFMSGWFRDEGEQTALSVPTTTPTAQPVPTPIPSISEEDMQRILSALSEVSALKDEVRQLRTVSVQEIAAPTAPAIPEQAASKTPALEDAEKQIGGKQEGKQDYADLIEALWRENANITTVEVEKQLGCTRKTAAKHLQRLRPAVGVNKIEETD